MAIAYTIGSCRCNCIWAFGRFAAYFAARPGKIVRALSDQERAELKGWAEKYVQVAGYCLRNRINVNPGLQQEQFVKTTDGH